MENGLETISGDCCGAPEQGTEPPHVKRACSRQLSYSETSPSDDCIYMGSLYFKKGVSMVSHPHLGTDKSLLPKDQTITSCQGSSETTRMVEMTTSPKHVS